MGPDASHGFAQQNALKQIRSVPEAALLPVHPDIDLWQAAFENRTTRLDSLRVWRAAELAGCCGSRWTHKMGKV
jgi:hypothetical protein